jgi:hypothetical protein
LIHERRSLVPNARRRDARRKPSRAQPTRHTLSVVHALGVPRKKIFRSPRRGLTGAADAK